MHGYVGSGKVPTCVGHVNLCSASAYGTEVCDGILFSGRVSPYTRRRVLYGVAPTYFLNFCIIVILNVKGTPPDRKEVYFKSDYGVLKLRRVVLNFHTND